jgi:hypothetical protein
MATHGSIGHSWVLILTTRTNTKLLWVVLYFLVASDKQNSSTHERPVVHALALIPSIVVAIRGICVLLFLSVSHIDLKSLIHELDALVWASIPKEKLFKCIKGWTLFNAVAVAYCIGAFIPVCILNGIHMADMIHLANNGSVVLKPLTVAIPTWSYVLLEAIFSWFPYMLSQLVLLCVVTSCVVLKDCLTALNDNLRSLEAKMPIMVGKEKQLEAELNWTGKFDSSSYEVELSPPRQTPQPVFVLGDLQILP